MGFQTCELYNIHNLSERGLCVCIGASPYADAKHIPPSRQASDVSHIVDSVDPLRGARASLRRTCPMRVIDTDIEYRLS